MTWDIFCTVVDNYGDIGVAWRLARQLLAAQAQTTVRLWVDDLACFGKLCPAIGLTETRQTIDGVEIIHTASAPHLALTPAELVLTLFCATPPAAYLTAMVAAKRKPLWIHLEYLSAEDWIDTVHGQASPHPFLPLTRFFFCPGFSEQSGGILGPGGALPSFSDADVSLFWQKLELPVPAENACVISLFSYENPAIAELLALWTQSPVPIFCLVPEGKIVPDLCRYFARPLACGEIIQRGALSLQILPFSTQDQYDRLLAVCDLNIVRGEDSFVRAQWAARPFIWHIYPQKKQAHWVKLNAFLQRYSADLPPETRDTVYALHEAWNRGKGLAAAWPLFYTQAALWRMHAQQWRQHLLAKEDLVTRLLRFVS